MGAVTTSPRLAALEPARPPEAAFPGEGVATGLLCSREVSSWAGHPLDLAWPGPAGQVQGRPGSGTGAGPAVPHLLRDGTCGCCWSLEFYYYKFSAFLALSQPPNVKRASLTEGVQPLADPAFGRREAVWPPQPPGSAVDSDRRPLSRGPGVFPTVVVLPGRDSRGRWLS